MEITRLTKKNHYEEITAQLKQMMIDGRLKVGDKLPSTKELSERFGVGRSTMREALSALKAMGYIDIRQGGGSTVIAAYIEEVDLPELQELRMNRRTVLELIEARKSLEVSMAALAASHAKDADLKFLSEMVSSMERSIGDDQAGEVMDLYFHKAIANATYNSILIRMFESIAELMERAIQETRRIELYAQRDISEQLYREHRVIYQAILGRNADEAS